MRPDPPFHVGRTVPSSVGWTRVVVTVVAGLIVSGLRGFDVTSSSSTGLTLHYDDFASAAQASADAQVKLGFNFRAATSDSLTVGRTIGSAIVAAKMRPL